MTRRETRAKRLKRLNAFCIYDEAGSIPREALTGLLFGNPYPKNAPHPLVTADYAAIEARIMAHLCSTTLIVNHARVAAAPYGVWRTSPGVEALCLSVATSAGIVFG